MQALHQTDAGRDGIFGHGEHIGDVLVAGMGVVSFVGDWADDADAAGADRLVVPPSASVALRWCGGTAAADGSMQAFAVAIDRHVVAEQAGQDDAVA